MSTTSQQEILRTNVDRKDLASILDRCWAHGEIEAEVGCSSDDLLKEICERYSELVSSSPTTILPRPEWDHALTVAKSLGFSTGESQMTFFLKSEILRFYATEVMAHKMLSDKKGIDKNEEQSGDGGSQEQDKREVGDEEDDAEIKTMLAYLHGIFLEDYKQRIEAQELTMKLAVRAFASNIPATKDTSNKNSHAEGITKILAAVEKGQWDVDAILGKDDESNSQTPEDPDPEPIIQIPTSLASLPCQLSQEEIHAFLAPAASSRRRFSWENRKPGLASSRTNTAKDQRGRMSNEDVEGLSIMEARRSRRSTMPEFR